MWRQDWLVGADGLYRGAGQGDEWQRLGVFEQRVSCALRAEDRLVVGTWVGSGLWEIEADGRWVQMHDETLTEVLALAPAAGDPGLIAASPYGVATGRRDPLGALRWTSHSEDLNPNERFSNALLAPAGEEGRWLVGTEAGVLVASERGKRWQRSNLRHAPVRALLRARGAFWAGCDAGGVWRSAEGLHWEPVGDPWAFGPVYALETDGGRLLAGALSGVVWGDGAGKWHRSGPRALISALAADPQAPETWLAGASPGGLWRTEDAGKSWRQLGRFRAVRAILAPEGTNP